MTLGKNGKNGNGSNGFGNGLPAFGNGSSHMIEDDDEFLQRRIEILGLHHFVQLSKQRMLEKCVVRSRENRRKLIPITIINKGKEYKGLMIPS